MISNHERPQKPAAPGEKPTPSSEYDRMKKHCEKLGITFQDPRARRQAAQRRGGGAAHRRGGRTIWGLLLIAMLGLAAAGWAQDTATPGEQVALVWAVGDSQIHYLLFLPADYGADPDRRWPLVFFHHGSGQRGADANRVKVHGPPKIVEEDPAFPFIVLSPQVPLGNRPPEQVFEAIAQILDNVVDEYAVDDRRIYMTGLSMGGFNTWVLAHFMPPTFAALAPIAAGYVDFVAAECRVPDIPIWIFNGGRDNAVPFAEGERMANEMRACGANVRFTGYEDAGHVETWERAYGDPALWDWFLSHQLPLQGTETESAVTDLTWGMLKVR